MLCRGEADLHAKSVPDVRSPVVFVHVCYFVSLLSLLLSLLRWFDRVYSALLSPEGTEFMAQVPTAIEIFFQFLYFCWTHQAVED